MRHLIENFAAAEERLKETRFLAPRVKGGQVRTRVDGLVCTFEAEPQGFEGWGIFQAESHSKATLQEKASLPRVTTYLKLFKPFRVHLVQPLGGMTWLAYPVNASDARQRLGRCGPVKVHLVTGGRAFARAICRWDGFSLWFEKPDRAGDPKAPTVLAKALRTLTPPEELDLPGCTPELRAAYRLLLEQSEAFEAQRRVRCSEARLRKALEMGGGELRSFVDQGDFWTTHWTTGDGQHHTSAIHKSDLTVLSAGVCLSDGDEQFDLQSLVGVVEQGDW